MTRGPPSPSALVASEADRRLSSSGHRQGLSDPDAPQAQALNERLRMSTAIGGPGQVPPGPRMAFYYPEPHISRTVSSGRGGGAGGGVRRTGGSVQGLSDCQPPEAPWKLETTHPPGTLWSLPPEAQCSVRTAGRLWVSLYLGIWSEMPQPEGP